MRKKKYRQEKGVCYLCGGKVEGSGYMCKWCRKKSELKGAGGE